MKRPLAAVGIVLVLLAVAPGFGAGQQSADFTVERSNTTVTVGSSGEMTLELRNEGSSDLENAVVTVKSGSPELTFGRGDTATRYVGGWNEDATKTLTLDVSASQQSGTSDLPVYVTVQYETDSQQRRESPRLVTSVSPGPQQSFALSNVSADLRVGAEETFSATVTNDGPAPVSDAVVVLQARDRNVHLGTTEYALGDLAVDESARLSVPVEVSEAAAAGPRQISATVEYLDASGEQQTSERLSARVAVGPKRGVFTVEPENNTIAAGSTSTVTLRVTNMGDERLYDLDAKAFVDAPLAAVDDRAYVPSLGPGESTTVAFDLRAAGDAPARTRALELDFQYTKQDGDTRLSDTYTVPVELRPGESGGSPFLLAGAVAVVLLGLGGFAVTRFR